MILPLVSKFTAGFLCSLISFCWELCFFFSFFFFNLWIFSLFYFFYLPFSTLILPVIIFCTHVRARRLQLNLIQPTVSILSTWHFPGFNLFTYLLCRIKSLSRAKNMLSPRVKFVPFPPLAFLVLVLEN